MVHEGNTLFTLIYLYIEQRAALDGEEMGQASSSGTTYAAASRRSFQDACRNLETLIRCYVHDEYRVLWVDYDVGKGEGESLRHRRAVVAARPGERTVRVVSEKNTINGFCCASVVL